MTSQLRLRDFTGLMLLVGCGLLGFGCSATGGSRFRSAEGSKSIASVGDQPLPPFVGSPGSQITTDVPDPEPYRNPKARISGRVVDSQGRPVSGASVRLADGSSKAGKDVQTTTDPSGGFTLANLRPGSAYYLVAEANFGDDQGTVTGRAQADTSETGVQIQLGDSADDPPPARKSRSKTPNARPISDRVEGSSKSKSSGVNTEDLGPPVESADLIDGPETPPSKKANPSSTNSNGSEASSGWRRPGAGPDRQPDPSSKTKVDPEPEDQAEQPLDLDPGPKAKVSSSRSRPPAEPEDEEANPLPLALPPDAKASSAEDAPTRPIARRSPRSVVSVVSKGELASELDSSGQLALVAEAESSVGSPSLRPDQAVISSSPQPMPSLMDLADNNPAQRADAPQTLNLNDVPDVVDPPPPHQRSSEQPLLASNSNPAGSTPGEFVSDPNADSPARGNIPTEGSTHEPFDPSASYNPFAIVGAPAPDPSKPVDSVPSPPPARLNSENSATSTPDVSIRPVESSTGPVAQTDPPRPKKWADLAVAPVVAGAAAVGATAAVVPVVKNSATMGTAASRPNTILARRSRSATPPKADAEAFCQFDTKLNRLVDFQLPDLDGQPVRFRDFDADYVLLDFWGTWCEPCVDSIPHLIEVQKQYGPNKLKVVGIACEKTPVERRKAIVAAAAEKLGINYSVLVTSMDGDCPVQRDFQIRFYPTMILLDRKGKVVWRAEGATPSNMFRLDRALAATDRPTQTARR